jgi:N4-gp56 family major capsid protein
MAGQLWAVSAEGGFMYSDELSDILRTALRPRVKFRQLLDMRDADGKTSHRGERMYWNVYGDLEDPMRDLDERDPVPESNFAVAQNYLTITEAAIAVPYTGKSELLAKHSMVDIINNVLRDAARRYFDRKAYTEFKKAKITAGPIGGTSTTACTFETTGTSTVTNNVELGTGHIKAIVDYMKERNIPGFVDDDYVCISHVSTFRTFKNSLESIRQYTETGLGQIFNGEYGRYEGVRFIEQNLIPKGGAADSTTFDIYAPNKTGTADAWNNGKSSWAYFIGADTVGEAIVVPEEMRADNPSDFGRSKKVGVYYLGGMGLVHSTADDCRIVRWDSAA